MLMEAMRLSMLEHEEEQKKQAEAKKKEEEAARQKVGSISVGSHEPYNFQAAAYAYPPPEGYYLCRTGRGRK